MPSGNPGTERHLPGQWALKCGALRGLLPESSGPEAVPPGTPPPPHTHTMATLLLSHPHCSVWAKCMCTGYSLMARPGMPAVVSWGHNPRPALFHSPQYRPLAPIFIVARLVSEPVRGLCNIKRHPVGAVSFDTKSRFRSHSGTSPPGLKVWKLKAVWAPPTSDTQAVFSEGDGGSPSPVTTNQPFPKKQHMVEPIKNGQRQGLSSKVTHFLVLKFRVHCF